MVTAVAAAAAAPAAPLERVVTLPPPDRRSPCELVRVVTGPPDEPEPPPVECAVLVRVVAGGLEATRAGASCCATRSRQW